MRGDLIFHNGPSIARVQYIPKWSYTVAIASVINLLQSNHKMITFLGEISLYSHKKLQQGDNIIWILVQLYSFTPQQLLILRPKECGVPVGYFRGTFFLCTTPIFHTFRRRLCSALIHAPNSFKPANTDSMNISQKFDLSSTRGKLSRLLKVTLCGAIRRHKVDLQIIVIFPIFQAGGRSLLANFFH